MVTDCGYMATYGKRLDFFLKEVLININVQIIDNYMAVIYEGQEIKGDNN